MTTLTPKQENFCLKYIETGNASEAYRQSYNAENMKPETVHRKAAELLSDGKITARIEALQAEHKARHQITVDDLLAELEEARQMAKEKENPNAMTQATMGKAKLLGLDKQMAEVKTEEHSPFAEWLAEIEEMDRRGERRTLLTPRATPLELIQESEEEGSSSFAEWVNAQSNNDFTFRRS